MRFIFAILLLTHFIYATTLNVAIAANLTYVFPDIIKEFNKKYPNIKINTIISSSGKLASQIIHKAPYDIFLSANMKYPQNLYNMGLVKTKPKVYATGALVVFSTKYHIKNLYDLLDKKYQKIAIANKLTAPYGKAAYEVLNKKNLYKKLQKKFIYGQSVGQTLTFSFKADAGFVAKSYFYSDKLKKYHYLPINNNLYSPIKQAIVLISDKKEAKQFYDFILSDVAKNIFKSYGYN